MPITIIVGGQFGSEGKGKISACCAKHVAHGVRTGGPNAGHTVRKGRNTFVFRHLPCTSLAKHVRLYLAAGAIIATDILLQELRENNITQNRLMIDPQAVVISSKHLASETQLIERIGSTGKGVGAAVAEKVWRSQHVVLARDVKELSPYIGDVAGALHSALTKGERILLEGTQGAGLSLHHGHYPFVTSRDITAGSLCGEAGVGPTSVDRVLIVIRSYPIRVAGNSGPLRDELSWEEVTRRSGYNRLLQEFTTVTRKLRRIGGFNLKDVVRAVSLNGATEIALTFADYLDVKACGCTDYDSLPHQVIAFIKRLEDATGIPVTMIGTGPRNEDLVVRDETMMKGNSK